MNKLHAYLLDVAATSLNLLFIKAFPLVLYCVILLQIGVGFGIFYISEHFHQFGRNDDTHAAIEPFGIDTNEAEVDHGRLFQGFQEP